ncbi:hypothetical protein XENORESO_008558 [Xenotaenia resolanae]|uniref:Uncharacterized protein n=1 Tax=Xenotaenia resolanae TaxID=208358 RepID=A0ABV0WUN0_9TELE
MPSFSELLYYLSTILDSRYKYCYFDTTLRGTAINGLQQEVHRMTNDEDTDKTPAEEEGRGKKRHKLSDESRHSRMNMFNERVWRKSRARSSTHSKEAHQLAR